MPVRPASRARGLTIIELVTVLVVIMILAVLLMPAWDKMRRRAQRVQCMTNLRNLHAAAGSYVTQHGSWPQIDSTQITTPAYAKAWIAALRPFGIDEKNWICPTVQEVFGNPNYLEEEHVRIDYTATPFDAHPYTPYKWSKQPWFVEKGDMHGVGNLILFPDGRIEGLLELRDSQTGN
ncbi:MAG: hypothetical protein M3463_05920 [Verrucomicrobiota bacterium]|nr:hypothetical protein [Verrucomicrobiota bacterium]